MFAPLAALTLLPFVLGQSGPCTRSYTVQAGDTCDSISAAHNVSSYQFATVNYGKVNRECNNLRVGENYCLGTEGEDCTQTYVVKPGDYCEKIQAAFGINATILYENNPNIDQLCYTIYVGQVLCVAPTVTAPPPVGQDDIVHGEPANPPPPIQTIPAPQPEVTPPPPPPPVYEPPASDEPADEEPVDEEPAPPAPPPAPPANDDEDEDDEDLPECEDWDDDGYY